MISLYLALLLIPALAIWAWNKAVSQFTMRSWGVYKTTGIIGSPIHELSHAIGCILFGLRIKRVVLYAPDAITGQLGHVLFTYNPFSVRNTIGLVVQGVAPLLAGGAIAVLTLSTANKHGIPDQGVWALMIWVWAVAGGAISALIELGSASWSGLVMALLVLIVCMHSIPSTSDIAVGFKGFAIITFIFGGLVFVLQVIPGKGEGIIMRSITRGADSVSIYLEQGMWHVLNAAITVVTLSLLASLFFILIPAGISCVKSFWDGAHGKV